MMEAQSRTQCRREDRQPWTSRQGASRRLRSSLSCSGKDRAQFESGVEAGFTLNLLQVQSRWIIVGLEYKITPTKTAFQTGQR